MITVMGDPRGKERPRAVRRGGSIVVYTPQETKDYEKQIAWEYVAQGGKYSDKPIKCHINAYLSMPNSASAKRRKMMLEGKILPTKKPDIDNIAKIVLDGLNGVAYKDDTQITFLCVTKLFSDLPRLEIEITNEDFYCE